MLKKKKKRHPKFDKARSERLLAALRGEEPTEEEVKEDVEKALDVSGNIVATLETLPDVNHKQRRIAYLLARDILPVEVASRVGCTVAYVRALMPDPRITELVKMFRGGKLYDLAEEIGARDILKLASARAAEILAEKMNFAVDEATQLRAAVEILKATGETGGNDRNVTEIVIERDSVKIFNRAVQEEADDVQEAEFTEETTSPPVHLLDKPAV